MKKIAFKNHSTKLSLVGTLLLMAPLFASCDLDDEEEPILIIEPPTGGFIIDEDGIPRRDDGTTQLSEDEKQLITNEVIGHGWKWLHTYEINEHGAFYGAKDPGYFDWTIAIDYNMGDVRLNVPNDVPNDNYFLLNFLSVFKLDGQWYITAIERLGMNGNGIGMTQSGFGVSEYVRMTDEELAKFQHEYTTDWRMVN